jgi:cytochrome P450
MGAALARLEAKVALSEFLRRVGHFELASAEPWPPREGMHVHGPARLPIRFKAASGG